MNKKVGIIVNDLLCLSANEAYKIADEIIFIDIREDYLTKFKKINMPNVFYLPFSKIEEWKNNLPKDKLLVIFDSVGNYSRYVADILKKEGYENLAILAGGFIEWEKCNLPVIINKNISISCPCLFARK